MPLSGSSKSRKSAYLNINEIQSTETVKQINRRLFSLNLPSALTILDDQLLSYNSRMNRLPVTASPYSFSSSSASDTQTLTVTGLDENFNEISESIQLTGTTPAVTTLSFLRWYTFTITSGAGNVGTITCTQNALPVGVMSPTINYSENGIVTIPAGYTGKLLKAYAITSRNSEVITQFRIRPSLDFGDIFITGARYVTSAGAGIIDEIKLPVTLNEMSDIMITANSEAGNADCSGLMDIVLIKNEV